MMFSIIDYCWISYRGLAQLFSFRFILDTAADFLPSGKKYMQVKMLKQSSVGALFGSYFSDWQQLELEDMPCTSIESGYAVIFFDILTQ